MTGYQFVDYQGCAFSVAMTDVLSTRMAEHFAKWSQAQEDLLFAYWRPSRGAKRFSAIVMDLLLPLDGERILRGNVSFTLEYLTRVLNGCAPGDGVALIHSHLGPGWQDLSYDDVVAERDRLASVVCSKTDLPLLGLTWSTDGFWSARFWLRTGRRRYSIRHATNVRTVGKQLRISFHPILRPRDTPSPAQEATVSVWGEEAQSSLCRSHVGVIGLGSVGSIVAEALSRTGIQKITLIDNDKIETRNLDRTLGALPRDAFFRCRKVKVSERLLRHSHTGNKLQLIPLSQSLLTDAGLAAALDCDVLISCVDRPLPRSVLNTLSYAHLIPLIDGGIMARVAENGKLLHVDWRIHTVGPGHACLYCINALRRSDVALDRDGMLDDPDYIRGLSHADRERYRRRNVFAFSLSVAAHEFLQLVTLISGNQRIGGRGPQTYHAFPGAMEVAEHSLCVRGCDVAAIEATAVIPSIS